MRGHPHALTLDPHNIFGLISEPFRVVADICRLRRQLAERARGGVDLVLPLAGREHLALVDEVRAPRTRPTIETTKPSTNSARRS
jgi:hypothetical protein